MSLLFAHACHIVAFNDLNSPFSPISKTHLFLKKALKNDSTTDREIGNELNLISLDIKKRQVHSGTFIKINILNYSVAERIAQVQAFQANDIF